MSVKGDSWKNRTTNKGYRNGWGEIYGRCAECHHYVDGECNHEDGECIKDENFQGRQ